MVTHLKHICWILVLLLLASCHEVSQVQRDYVDSLNYLAYHIRYSDVDSTRSLANKAYLAAGDYTDGKARAQNLLAYVDYQQMNFASAFERLDSVNTLTNNQVILLVSDVLRMKINQRIGKGVDYFESRNTAQRRMKRTEEEFERLSEADCRDYFFARTEYHIISSTYCYYQGQEQQAISEMDEIADDFTVVTDSTQWLYYNYMMGSGGLVVGTPSEVAVKEFDYLMLCQIFSRSMGVTYFEANSLQALASLLSSPERTSIIREKNPDLYNLLLNHHADWLPLDSTDAESCLPDALAQHAVYAFREYKDLFQTACAYRTLGEMSFRQGFYDRALDYYEMALDCVNEQYLYNNRYASDRLLSLYDDVQNEGQAGVELSWIDSDSIYTVPEWIAGIRQQISMAFSALDLKDESNYNRNIYLQIIARTSQNVEMESRMSSLQQEVDELHLRLLVTFLVFAMVVALIILYSYRLRKSNEIRLKASQASSVPAVQEKDARRMQELEEKAEEAREKVQLCSLKIDTNKRRNAEKRAKVSMVHAVTPFLDRIINQVDRMNRDGIMDPGKLQYIMELTDRIVCYNDILTDWIKMEQGELSLKISTIKLEPIFQTLRKGHYAFDQKGITLEVQETDLSVKADEALTLFMLNTLADNARKFTPDGGKVSVKAESTDEYVELSVSDTGCGMSPEDVDTLNNSKVYDSRRIGLANGESDSHVQQNKGFGFGIMNCKGIIEKYRKTSAIFQVCSFGVESQPGKGSRFFFRLPRVMALLFMLFLSSLSFAQDEAGYYHDMATQYYVDGKYEKAMEEAMNGLKAIEPRLQLDNANELETENTVNEIELFLDGTSLDYDMVIQLRGDIAASALALHQWDTYHYNNDLCTALYKLYHQDHSLPTYCKKLEQTQSTSLQLQVLLALFILMAVVLSLMILRRRMYLGKGLLLQQQLCRQIETQDEDTEVSDMTDLQEMAQRILHVTLEGLNGWMHVDGLKLMLQKSEESTLMVLQDGNCDSATTDEVVLGTCGKLVLYGLQPRQNDNLTEPVYKTLAHILGSRIVKSSSYIAQIDHENDELGHLLYESHRLHVQNQVLDNCLSTIKHESMYYPSRIRQLAERISRHGQDSSDSKENKLFSPLDDLKQLTELSYYYKEVYTLLSSQVDKLTMQNCYRKETLVLGPFLEKAVSQFGRLARKRKSECQLLSQITPGLTVHADAVLIEELLSRFNAYILDSYLQQPHAMENGLPILRLSTQDGMACICYKLPGIDMDESQAHSLFYPESGNINLLVCKQIVRELDALNNFPGLRLIALSQEGGAEILLTLK